jgi:hypothetical protein
MTNILLMNDIQSKALHYAKKKAKIFNKQVYYNSLTRFINMGYDEDLLHKVIDYITKIDLIIHFDGRWLSSADKIKNGFEIFGTNTNTFLESWTVQRLDWENNLFGGIYDKSCDPSLRVKYGCLNLLNDRCGCRSATVYGQSYAIMKNEIKNRTSFIAGDSSGKQSHICTFDHFSHLLLYISDKLLRDIITTMCDSSEEKYKNISGVSYSYEYIEAQIHGDIDIKNDIEKIMLSKNQISKDIIDRLVRDKIKYDII